MMVLAAKPKDLRSSFRTQRVEEENQPQVVLCMASMCPHLYPYMYKISK